MAKPTPRAAPRRRRRSPSVQYESEWHLDKKVPVLLILALVGQTFGAGWWGSQITKRVETLEQNNAANQIVANRVGAVELKTHDIEGKIDGVVTGVKDIKDTIGAITTVQIKPPPGMESGPSRIK